MTRGVNYKLLVIIVLLSFHLNVIGSKSSENKFVPKVSKLFQIVDYYKSQKRIYRYGKWDCSKFCQNVYSQLNKTLPRTSRQQALVGETISLKDIQAGDLVFFDTKGKNDKKVNHVGIYLGNQHGYKNCFVHNSRKKKGVVFENFSAKFFQTRLVTIKRLIDFN